MVPAQMFHHLELLLGRVGAVATGERRLLGVRQVVMPETGRPPEGLLAQTACVRPPVAVLPLVRLQDETGLEGLAAFLADVGTQVRMLRILVSTKGVHSVGAVVTLVAYVGLLSCVLGHVILQLGGPLAFVATLRAEVLLFLLVNSHVKLQP